MRKFVFIFLFAVLTLAALSAAPAAKTKGPTGSDFAFIFDLKNLLLSIEEFEDGFQTGAGIKWWAMDILAVRALANFRLNSLNDVTTTSFGLSGGAEWHPIKKKVTPYAGGFAGIRATTISPEVPDGNRIDFYFGGMGGAEFAVWENLSFYAEYNLLVSRDINGWTIDLGGQNSAQLGLLVYF